MLFFALINKLRMVMKCELCNSETLDISNYYQLSFHMLFKKLAYLLPEILLSLFKKNVFVKKILINKQYFNKKKVRCSSCDLGFVYPKFKTDDLNDYYKKQYWEYRDRFEGSHLVNITNEPQFSDAQISLGQKRIEFIEKYIHDFNSVIDFGSGDCSASYLFKRMNKEVTAFDYSEKSRELCKKLGIHFESDISMLGRNDLIYSSHSLEHVESLEDTLNIFLKDPISAKYLFFETPNIESIFIFNNLIHTPHTYMFNKRAFSQIAKKFNLKLLGFELCGGYWRGFKGHEKDSMSDIRVLLSK